MADNFSRDHDEQDDGFQTLHPDRGDAGEIPSESVTHGLNADFSAWPETAYIRCKKCGFIMNKARHPKGWGTGVKSLTPSTWGASGYSGSGDNIPYQDGYWDEMYWDGEDDPAAVTAGCPFCGTFLYD